MNVKFAVWAGLSLCAAIVLSGCATAPAEPQARALLSAETTEAIAIFKQKDPGIERFFNDSYAYAVLPEVGKGAILVGWAYGKGEVFVKNEMVGYCSVDQGTLGASLGGEYYREIVFFRDKPDFDKFTTDEYTFSAQFTAVAATAGVTSKTDYKAGMAVFVTMDNGLMADISLGGQKFRYLPKATVEEAGKTK
jgi:lipid-binding SYLF domain-containing protein